VGKEIRLGTRLQHKTEITVRFNEADPLGVVWHGHYIRYFEDGREAFGKEYGLSYLDCYHNGFAIPVVAINCDFKRPLRYGASVIVETTFISSPAAKLYFEYRIFETAKNQLVATGKSTQVFVNVTDFGLHLTVPDFFEKWKQNHHLE
jgi:acyl-CoA thioester hydrolase